MSLEDAVFQYGTKPVQTVSEDETLGYLITEMNRYRYRRFPVIDSSDSPIGMITSTDILGAMHQKGDSTFLKMPISEVMNDRIMVVQHDDSVRSVIELMYNIGISGVPILTNGKISGMMTEKDLMLLNSIWKSIPDTTITHESGPGRPVDLESVVTDQHTFWQIADVLKNHAQRQVLVKSSENNSYLGIITIMTLLNSLVGGISLSNPNFEMLQTLSPVDMQLRNLFQRSTPMLLSSARLWMNSRGLEAFPLFHRGKPVKLMTEKDLMGYLANNLS